MNRLSGLRPIAGLSTLPFDGGADYDMPLEQSGIDLDIGASLRAIWSAVYRNRLLIIAIIGVSMLLGIVSTMLTTPKYMASASVQIDQQATKVLGTEDQPTVDPLDADRFLQTQVDVLHSRAIAEKVMETLHLADPFVVAMGAKPLDTPTGNLSLSASKREQVLNLLDKGLTVDLPRTSRVVAISFKSRDPVLAMKVANSFATNFITMNLKRKYDQSAYARDFLQQQLVGAKQRLEDSERATLSYSRSVGLIDASAGIGTADNSTATNGPRSLVTSDLVSLNTAYSAASANRVAAQQRWEQAQRTPLLSLPEVLTNPAISQLQQLRAQSQAAYDQDRQRRKADYPSLLQLSAQITGYDRQIAKIAGAIRDSIRDQFLTAQAQEGALGHSVEELKTATLSEQDKSVQYNILKRETDTNRTMYDGLLQRYKEVSAEAGISANNISIVDTADVPARPVSPKPLVNLALATIAGMLIAGVIVLVREKFDDAVRSPDDIPAKLGLTLLNTVPLLKPGETPQEMMADPRSALSESYAALRTSLELVNADGMPDALLFTSSRSGEGKSTSAYAIARDFARLGKRVILIDSDLRRPSLHRTLGLPNNNGFASVLARHRQLEDVIQATSVPNLAFLSTGPLPPSPAELLSSALLKQTLQQLRDNFDLVVIDGPPVLGLADAVILANNVGGVVFVIEANGSHHGHAKAAIRRLQATGSPILGALLTKYDARKVGYGYDYGYYAYNYGIEAGGKPKDA